LRRPRPCRKPHSVSERTPVESSAGTRPAFPWATLALAGWGVGALVVLARIVIGRVGVRRLAAHAVPLDDEGWMAVSRDVAAFAGVKRRFSLLRSDHQVTPMMWGLFRPIVLLPRDADGWPAARRRVVLLHELAHAKRWQCLVRLLAQAACAMYWLNPLVWLAARRLRVEREQACDDLVLTAGTRPSDYADHLVAVVRSLRAAGVSVLGGVAMANDTRIEARLAAILDPSRRRGAPGKWTVSVALAAVMALGLLLAPMNLTSAQDAPSRESAVQKRDEVLAKALAKRVTIDFPGTSAIRVCDFLADRLNVPVEIDAEAPIHRDTPVVLKVANITAESCISLIAQMYDMEYVCRGQRVVFTSWDRLAPEERRQVLDRDQRRHRQAAETWRPTLKEALEKKVSVEFDTRHPDEAFRLLRDLSGVNLVLSHWHRPPSRRWYLKADLKEVTLRDALAEVMVTFGGPEVILVDEVVLVERSPAVATVLKRRFAGNLVRHPAVAKALAERVTVEFPGTHLGNVIDFANDLLRQKPIRVVLDPEANIDREQLIRLKLTNVQAESWLSHLARQIGLEYVCRDRQVVFTTWERLTPEERKRLVERNRRKRQEAEATWIPRMKETLGKHVSIEFPGTGFNNVVDFYQDLTGLNLVLDRQALSDVLKKRVTLKLKDVPLAEALDKALAQVGAVRTFADEAILITTPATTLERDPALDLALAKPVTVEFPGKTLEAIAGLFSDLLRKQGQIRFSLDPKAGVAPETKVHVRLSNVQLESAVAHVARQAGLEYVSRDRGIVFTSWGRLTRDERERVLRRDRRRAEETAHLWDLKQADRIHRFVDVEMAGAPLEKAIERVQDATGSSILIDRRHLAGDEQVNVDIRHVPGMAALDEIAAQIGAVTILVDEAILITTPTAATAINRGQQGLPAADTQPGKVESKDGRRRILLNGRLTEFTDGKPKVMTAPRRRCIDGELVDMVVATQEHFAFLRRGRPELVALDKYRVAMNVTPTLLDEGKVLLNPHYS